MKKVVFLMAVSLITASCSLFTGVSGITETTDISSSDSTDGSSYEEAIVIRETITYKAVNAEYDWLRMHYPGYRIIHQSVSYYDNQPYDIFSVKTKNGDVLDIYFNISSFYGDL